MNMAKQILAVLGLAGFVFVNSARASGCEVSKKFQVKKTQRLSGELKDPRGDPIPGFRLDLLKDGKAVMSRTADNDGVYDFGEVSPGKYKISLSREGRPTGFCAPEVKCDDSGCKISPVLKLGPSTTVVM